MKTFIKTIMVLASFCFAGSLLFIGVIMASGIYWVAYETRKTRKNYEKDLETISKTFGEKAEPIAEMVPQLLPDLGTLPEPELDVPELIPQDESLEDTEPPEKREERPLLIRDLESI